MRFEDFNFSAGFDDFKGAHREAEEVRLMVVDARRQTITEDMFLNLGNYLKDDDTLAYNDVGIAPSRLKGQTETGIEIDLCFLLLGASADGTSRWDVVLLAEQDPPTEGGFSLGQAGITGRFLGKKLDFDGGYWIEKDRYLGYRGEVALDADEPTLQRALATEGLLMHPWYANLNELPSSKVNPETATKSLGALVSEPARRISRDVRAHFRERGMGEIFFSLAMSFSWRLAGPQENLSNYSMNEEEFSIDEANVAALRDSIRAGRRIVCVGTSAARTLESLALPPQPLSGRTDLFISPGFQFKYCSVLLTNLHNPMGTHVIMASAFGGRELVMEACEQAVRSKMRFGIHGDSMLVIGAHDLAGASNA